MSDLISRQASAQPEQSTDIQDILQYLDNVIHPLVSPENWNVYSELHDMISNLPSAQPESTRTFVELVVEYPDPELCTYKEYKGYPYYSIKYIENGETYVGYSTYNPEVLSQYLKEYFISSAQPKQKTGKWIEYISEHGKCSRCGNQVDLLDGKEHNFCEVCGADMRGDTECKNGNTK